MKILFIGDIMGRPGREAFARALPSMRTEYGPFDFIVANGENSAAGRGLTEKIMNELFSMGIDILTSGNHIWDKKDFIPYLDSEPRVLRPANYPEGAPGRGFGVYEKNGEKLAVICLQGRAFMPPLDCPFKEAERILEQIETTAIFVDMHAEASSEKRALALKLDGKVSAVVGTHTHVQTADEEVLPSGTAFISDVGMTGGHAGVIGMTYESVIPKFLYGTPSKFEICNEGIKLQAVAISIDNETGRAMDIKRINISL
ncbi:MAG: TIGR00282 family metallophosphoesterase [Synergistaceae bacterium]|jgi:metallophosphoesterase (TIGR00282 family)|nr:TIGR00282 family metallophosphoesterase [Synergistaceae bacterium]